MSSIQAVKGKAVVALKPSEDKFESGLFIPESHRTPNTHAVVVSSGVPDVESGDTVLLSGEYAGASFKVDGVEYVTVVGEEILAVLE